MTEDIESLRSLAPLLALSEEEFVEEMIRRFRQDGEPRDDEALARMSLRLARAGLLLGLN